MRIHQLAGFSVPVILLHILLLTQSSAQTPRPPGFSSALELGRQQDYPAAISLLNECVQSDSAFTAAYLTAADFYFYDGRSVDGMAHFRTAGDKNPGEPNNLIALARLAYLAGDSNGAFEMGRSAFERGATSPLALNMMVRSAVESRKTDALQAVLRKLRKDKARRPLFDLGYAIWRLRIGNLARGKTSIKAYLENVPGAPFGQLILGQISRGIADLPAAMTAFKQAALLCPATDRETRIDALLGLARSHSEVGNADSSLHFTNLALDNAMELCNLQAERDARVEQCLLLEPAGSLLALVECAKSGATVARKLGDDIAEFRFKNLLGKTYITLNDVDAGLDAFLAALNCARDMESRAEIAGTSLEIARVLNLQGMQEEAVAYLDSSQASARAAGRHDLSHQALLLRADIYRTTGKIPEAKKAYETVLRFAQKQQQSGLTELCFIRLANMYMQPPNVNLDNAKYYLSRADALARQTFQLHFAATHRWMQGSIALKDVDIESAETYFQQAIQLGLETGSYLSLVAGQAGLVRTYLATNFPSLAAAHADTALKLLYDYNTLCQSEPAFAHFRVKNDLIMPAVNAFAAVGNLGAIYRTTEMWKAMQYQELTHEATITISSTLADSVRTRSNRAHQEIQDKWLALWQSWKLDRVETLDLLMRTKREIHEITRQQINFLDNVKQADPKLYSLLRPDCPDPLAVQDQLTRLDATYVSYLLGDNATFITVIGPDGIHGKRANVSRSRLERLVHEMTPVCNPTRPELGSLAASGRIEFRLDQATQLYDYLIAPIREWLVPQTTIIISADDVLNLVPFEALVSNPQELIDNFDYANARYLIQDYAIAYSSSAYSFLGPALPTNSGNRHLLAFAKPSATAKNGSADDSNGVANSIVSESLREVTALADVFGRGNSDVHAGEKAALTALDKPTQVLHFAVPVTINGQEPLSSRLELNGTQGKYLYARELLNARMEANLAVLSGGEFRMIRPTNHGLGINGLLQGFSFAGVKSTLASMWPLSGREQTPLVAEFYENLKLNMTKPRALQQAQLSYLETISRNPYFWSNLRLFGHPGAMQFETNRSYTAIYLVAAGLLLLVGLVARQIFKTSRAPKRPEASGQPA